MRQHERPSAPESGNLRYPPPVPAMAGL